MSNLIEIKTEIKAEIKAAAARKDLKRILAGIVSVSLIVSVLEGPNYLIVFDKSH